MIFFRKTGSLRIFLQIDFTFGVVLVLAKITGQRERGHQATARSRLSATYSRPLVTNAPDKITPGGGGGGILVSLQEC